MKRARRQFIELASVVVVVAVTVFGPVALAAGSRKVEVADPVYQMTAYTVDIQEFKNPNTGQTIEASSQYQ